jgi:hypothetical protein
MRFNVVNSPRQPALPTFSKMRSHTCTNCFTFSYIEQKMVNPIEENKLLEY